MPYSFYNNHMFDLVHQCTDMSSTSFIEPLLVVDFVAQLLNRDVSSRPLSDADRVKVNFCIFLLVECSEVLIIVLMFVFLFI